MHQFRALLARATDVALCVARLRSGVVLLGVMALTVGGTSPAFSHGIGGDAAKASVPGFIAIGVEHMLLGWDHLLFVAGIVLLADSPRRGAKVISAFVLGHSLTLITATLAGWQVNATMVDVVIVLSVAFVGGYGLVLGRPQRWGVFTAIVFGFGLVHGLGLATRFQAIGVADDRVLWRLLAFNVGIEIGQLTAIVGVLALAALVSMVFKFRFDAALTRAAFLALFTVGAVVAPVLAYQSITRLVDADDGLDLALPPGSGCAVTERTEQFPSAGGGHTTKWFYAPNEATPMNDFGHALGDGYLLILYPDDANTTDVALLREFVDTGDSAKVLAGAHDDPTGDITAFFDSHEMTCTGVQVESLDEFSRAWMEWREANFL